MFTHLVPRGFMLGLALMVVALASQHPVETSAHVDRVVPFAVVTGSDTSAWQLARLGSLDGCHVPIQRDNGVADPMPNNYCLWPPVG